MYERQVGIISPEKLKYLSATVVGVGAVGGYAALSLSKMGVKPTIIDPDTVEEENIAPQIYRPSDKGKKKVDACKEIIKEFTGLEIAGVACEYIGESAEVLIATVDSMKIRKDIFEKRAELFIDGRMMGEVGRIITIKKDDPDDLYLSTWHTDEASEPAPCSARSIVYNTSILGNLIVNQIKKYVCGEDIPRDILVDLVNCQLIS